MNKNQFVGREKEIEILESLLTSEESEFVSVIGRRRVGKTFLIESVYAEKLAFEITGIQNASLAEQLENFSVALNLKSQSVLLPSIPKTWLEAFRLLILYLENTKTSEKRVIFFDELPWLSSHKSGFLNAFGFFWNSWAVKNNVVVVICGSSASWMIQKVVNNKGGLYNRITKRIHLRPFSLNETEQFLQKRGHNLNRNQITELYMMMGGIPHYLKEIKRGESVAQNIDRICFSADGSLFDEFINLYPSLFEHSENHVAVIRALASKHYGMTRTEITQQTKFTNGGGLTKVLEELSYSGFIADYQPLGRLKRETIYRLSDEYSLFYLKFIENLKREGTGVWQAFEQTQTYKTWAGYAFENVCLKHIPALKKALGISGIYSTTSSFYQKGKDGMNGCQIDLLIDRNDKVINLCEIKWTNTNYIITKSYSEELREKMALFKHYSKTNKQVFLTFISSLKILQNEHSQGIVDNEIGLDSLFTVSS
jgi:uncharacterized protein